MITFLADSALIEEKVSCSSERPEARPLREVRHARLRGLLDEELA
jgi:hypothetical protein